MFSTPSTADECRCLWQGSFNQVAKNTPLVVSGTITRHKGNAADFQIKRVIKGKEFRQTIRLWGAYHQECRPPISDFPVGSQWLMALHSIDTLPPNGFNPNTPNMSYGRVDDYYISQCGAYWLSLQEDFVSGNLINGQRWQWVDEKMNPVLIDLIGAYLQGVIPEAALIEAAKPQTESKRLMEKTKQFLNAQ